MIDTINGAKSSAIIYSIAETAKANNLNPFRYFELLLTEISRHMEDSDRTFLKRPAMVTGSAGGMPETARLTTHSCQKWQLYF